MLVSGVLSPCYNACEIERLDEANRFIITYLDPDSEEVVYAVKRLIDLQKFQEDVFAAICFKNTSQSDFYKLKTKYDILNLITVFSDSVNAAGYYL